MKPGASIVNICSVAALSGHVAAAYTASKWALRGLSRTASLELGARGIRVNAVMPGLVETPLMANASPAFREAALAEIPLGRTGTVDDIAPLDHLPDLRRLGVPQRRRDRRRRRPHRARLPQGHRRRHPAAGMRFGSLRAGGAVLTDDAAYLLPDGLTVGAVVALGLDRALEHGTTAVRGDPSRSRTTTC